MAKDKKKKEIPTDAEIRWANFYHMGTKLNIYEYEEEAYACGKERYGKAEIQVYYLYDENYGISDMLFDLRDVYEKYGGSKSDLHSFLVSVNAASKKTYFSCDWKSIEEENFEALGIALCTDQNNGKPLAHFGDILVDLKNALDRALGQNVNDLTLDKVDKFVLGGLKNDSTMKTMIFFGLLMVFGIILIIIGQLVWGIIATVIGFLVGGFLFIGYSAITGDYKKQRINEEFKPASRSRFR